MVPHVEQRSGPGQAGEDGLTGCGRQEAESHCKAHEAGILHGRVGQHALHVALRDGKRDAAHRAHRSQHDQQVRPPERRRSEQRKKARQPVEAHRDHDRRHEGGDVGRCGGVGVWQPHVQRCDSRLGSEADQREREQQAGRDRSSGGEGGDLECAARRSQKKPQQEEGGGRQMPGDEVLQARRANRGGVVIAHDERPRAQGHQLPGDEQEHEVVRGHDEGHAQEQRVVRSERPADGPAVRVPAQVRGAVHRAERPDEREGQQKDCRERIEPQAKGTGRHAPRRSPVRRHVGGQRPSSGVPRRHGPGDRATAAEHDARRAPAQQQPAARAHGPAGQSDRERGHCGGGDRNTPLARPSAARTRVRISEAGAR